MDLLVPLASADEHVSAYFDLHIGFSILNKALHASLFMLITG